MIEEQGEAEQGEGEDAGPEPMTGVATPTQTNWADGRDPTLKPTDTNWQFQL